MIKHSKPTTPGQRQLVEIDRSSLWGGRPVKSLTCGFSKTGGRNNQGRITSWQKGGGHKRLYRSVDFYRSKLDVKATIERLEYDPNRTSFLALIRYDDGDLSYILAPQKLSVGDVVIASEKTDVKPGNSMLIKNIPIGTIIHNLEIKIGRGGQLVRSAGSYAQIMARDAGYVIVRLSSGEVRLVHGSCRATVGALSNPDHQNRSYGKAGRTRWQGRRPHVRGVAMNPIDHPHGGGEGRTSGGRHPVTPWGIGTKGKKTRTNKRTSTMIIKKRK